MEPTATLTSTLTANKAAGANRTRFLSLAKGPATSTSASTSTSTTTSTFAIWECYKGIAIHHRWTLEILDDALSKLLFWLPHSDGSEAATESGVEEVGFGVGDAAWREVGYGILSLHRLSMHLALEEDSEQQQDQQQQQQQQQQQCERSEPNNYVGNSRLRKHHYGTSIRTKDPPTVSATTFRICLTVLHSIMPSLISLAMLRARNQNSKYNQNNQNNNTNRHTNSQNIAAAASRARLVLEQAKFLLRLCLLVPYWKQQQQQQQHQSPTAGNGDGDPTPADYGIMLDGGLYHSHQHQESVGIPWDHALALQKRRNYVGERTGWKASTTANPNHNSAAGIDQRNHGKFSKLVQRLFGDSASANTNANTNTKYRNAKTAIADLLYAARPLLWAWFESRYHESTRGGHRGRGNIPGLSLGATTPYQQHPHPQNTKRPSLLKGWLLCLAMDVFSIRLLKHKSRNNSRNSSGGSGGGGHEYRDATIDGFASDEVRRRKIRLLLYVLRSPVWSNHTLPLLETVSETVLRKIPVLGNLAETVLWDWILYYQHPFVSEEG